MSLAVIRFCWRRLPPGPLDRLDARVERGGDRVPVMEKGVFIEADVDEHRLEAGLEVLDLALVDAAGNLAVAFALDGEFLEPAAFQDGDPLFQPLAGNDDFFFVAFFLKTEKSAYFV